MAKGFTYFYRIFWSIERWGVGRERVNASIASASEIAKCNTLEMRGGVFDCVFVLKLMTANNICRTFLWEPAHLKLKIKIIEAFAW